MSTYGPLSPSPKRSCLPDWGRLEREQTEGTEERVKISVLTVTSCLTSPTQMHPLYQKAAGLTEPIIAAAIEVHRDKGPGLLESIYEWCLLQELGLRSLRCDTQKSVLIRYKG